MVRAVAMADADALKRLEKVALEQSNKDQRLAVEARRRDFIDGLTRQTRTPDGDFDNHNPSGAAYRFTREPADPPEFDLGDEFDPQVLCHSHVGLTQHTLCWRTICCARAAS